MTGLTVLLLGVALVVAALDWHAVATARPRWRPVTKTVPMVLLIAAAIVEHRSRTGGPTTPLHRIEVGVGGALPTIVDGRQTDTILALGIAAAALSLLGDVLLLPQVDSFVGGLASFLAAHLAYVAAFLYLGVSWPRTALGFVVIAAALSPLVLRIVRSVRANEPPLLVPVVVYIAVITAMAATAIGTGEWVLAVGALLFCASDAQLAWNRFVQPSRALDVGCITTYHLAQALLVMGLVAVTHPVAHQILVR